MYLEKARLSQERNEEMKVMGCEKEKAIEQSGIEMTSLFEMKNNYLVKKRDLAVKLELAKSKLKDEQQNLLNVTQDLTSTMNQIQFVI